MLITRTIVRTTYKIGQFYLESGKANIKEIGSGAVLNTRRPNDESLIKLERKSHPVPNLTVYDVKHEEELRGVELEDFMKLSKIILKDEKEN